MNSIFFEKQKARLSAQHALNMLLQGPYFTASDLSEIGLRLDRAERQAGMVEEAVSHNFDDNGFFSVQVISEALRRGMNLSMILLTHPDAVAYRLNPTTARGYICNLEQHWFAVRRFGNHWFELNSIKNGPQPISETHLNEFFVQQLRNGCSIFIVDGAYPKCRAEILMWQLPINGDVIPIDDDEDEQFRAALEMSRKTFDSEDTSLARALEASRLDDSAFIEDLELRQALKASQDIYSADCEHQLNEFLEGNIQQENEEDQQKAAMEMSLKETTNMKFEMKMGDLIASTSEPGPSGFSYPMQTPTGGRAPAVVTPPAPASTPAPVKKMKEHEENAEDKQQRVTPDDSAQTEFAPIHVCCAECKYNKILEKIMNDKKLFASIMKEDPDIGMQMIINIQNAHHAKVPPAFVLK